MATYMAVDASKLGLYWFILESRRASSSKYWARKKVTVSACEIFQ